MYSKYIFASISNERMDLSRREYFTEKRILLKNSS